MADTQRTDDDFTNASTGLFKTNTAGDIGSQEFRDMIVSFHLNRGSMYVSSASATTISVGSTWYKVAGTTTSVNLRNFTMPANNRLTYGGAPDVHGKVFVCATVTTASANKSIDLGVYHYDDSGASGSVLTHSIVNQYHDTTNAFTFCVGADVALEPSDYLELHIRNNTDGTNATVNYAYVYAEGMFV